MPDSTRLDKERISRDPPARFAALPVRRLARHEQFQAVRRENLSRFRRPALFSLPPAPSAATRTISRRRQGRRGGAEPLRPGPPAAWAFAGSSSVARREAARRRNPPHFPPAEIPECASPLPNPHSRSCGSAIGNSIVSASRRFLSRTKSVQDGIVSLIKALCKISKFRLAKPLSIGAVWAWGASSCRADGGPESNYIYRLRDGLVSPVTRNISSKEANSRGRQFP